MGILNIYAEAVWSAWCGTRSVGRATARPVARRAEGLEGEGENTLLPEVKEKLMEALREGARRGYGYRRIWKMLRESGVNVTRGAVQYWYRKSFPEKVRKQGKGKCLSRELRIRLYKKALWLRRKGLSYSKIIERIREENGVQLSRGTISHWVRGIRNPLDVCRIPSISFLKPSPELAYIIGTVCGDGHASKTRDMYIIGTAVKDEEFIDKFAECLGRVLSRNPPLPKRSEKDGLFRVRAQSKVLYELLKKPISIKRMQRFIEHCDECKKNFLRAFFDSEGSVTGRGCTRCVNTDIRLLRYVQKPLKLHILYGRAPH